MRALRWTASATLAGALFLITLEIGLRLFPQAIPLGVLLRFDPTLRSAIAARRDLMRRADTVLVARDDGGPPDRMWLYRPGSTVRSLDREEGVVPAVRADTMGFCNTDPIDLTPAFQAASRLYFRTNVHLTPTGHEIVAEEVARRIAGLRNPSREPPSATRS